MSIRSFHTKTGLSHRPHAPFSFLIVLSVSPWYLPLHFRLFLYRHIFYYLSFYLSFSILVSLITFLFLFLSLSSYLSSPLCFSFSLYPRISLQYLKDEALEFDTTDEMAALAADEEKVSGCSDWDGIIMLKPERSASNENCDLRLFFLAYSAITYILMLKNNVSILKHIPTQSLTSWLSLYTSTCFFPPPPSSGGTSQGLQCSCPWGRGKDGDRQWREVHLLYVLRDARHSWGKER